MLLVSKLELVILVVIALFAGSGTLVALMILPAYTVFLIMTAKEKNDHEVSERSDQQD